MVVIPTEVIVAIIVAIPPTIAVFVAHRKTRHELKEIHVLVDGRLSTALKEIRDLRGYIAVMSGGKRHDDPKGPAPPDETDPPDTRGILEP